VSSAPTAVSHDSLVDPISLTPRLPQKCPSVPLTYYPSTARHSHDKRHSTLQGSHSLGYKNYQDFSRTTEKAFLQDAVLLQRCLNIKTNSKVAVGTLATVSSAPVACCYGFSLFRTAVADAAATIVTKAP